MNADRWQKLTGYRFRQTQLLEQALTHRSFSRSHNNERLEFLGDSILNLVISNYIFGQFGDASEGELSRIRAALVNESCLAQVAREIDLGDLIKLGSGELKSGGFRRDSILSDALEAVIGAIYLDSGYSQAEQAVLHLYRQRLREIDPGAINKDPKTRLQELLQGRGMRLPVYRVIETRGKSHDQVFTVSCGVADLDLKSEGKGPSRKKAEQQAARDLLSKLDQ